MIDIKLWMDRFAGLQGRYGKGEATEASSKEPLPVSETMLIFENIEFFTFHKEQESNSAH